MQLHPPDYAGHDIRNAPNATTLCQCSAHSTGLCMPRHTEQSGVSSAGSIPRSTAAHTVFKNLSPASGRDIIPLFGIRGTGHGRRPASHTFNGCYSHRSFPPTASKMNISMTALIPRMPNIRRLLRRVGREARLETWRSANRASLMRSHSVVAAIAVHIH